MSKLLSVAALASLAQLAAASAWLGGVNIAGFDWGCPTTDGQYTADLVAPPLTSQNGADGVGQMQHFVDDDGLNIFRLPVCWQYLVDELGGSLDTTNAGIYDELVGGCLATGAYCVIDVHNYARWNGDIIGQSDGAVTNDQFASLWYNIAAKYADESKVIFGVMNEPHDLNIDEWATSVQYAVTSIRNAGATSQMILIPGSNYTSVGDSVPSGNAEALATVTNNDGTTTNLIYDVHQYIDYDYTGTHSTCAYTGVDGLEYLGDWLSTNGRQALLSETGGGNDGTCDTDLCAELDWINYHSDVYLGWIGWAAGSFSATDYALSETPVYEDGAWVDQDIVTLCVAGKFASS